MQNLFYSSFPLFPSPPTIPTFTPRSTTNHLLTSPFTTLPKNNATTVEVKIITLYGMLKSGRGSEMSAVGVRRRRRGLREEKNPGWRGEEGEEGCEERGGRREIEAPGTEKPRFASEGYSVYQSVADSYERRSWVVE